ncbi:hypothetical protein BDW42DRAFT_190222 [Aspergillus taichungensis]|uniref:Uncharacterized protein n=1 Tax=Aspergillus taichungensis TaxID=482145 RepID=A0A2J5I8T3_9EURO|nr:hypothetical protein BDW42DRAFT_190222 [Aspergillus taichungensis]
MTKQRITGVQTWGGLDTAFKAHPTKFEHAKFRSSNNYVNKRVVVDGPNVSSADLVADLHVIVKGPLPQEQDL